MRASAAAAAAAGDTHTPTAQPCELISPCTEVPALAQAAAAVAVSEVCRLAGWLRSFPSNAEFNLLRAGPARASRLFVFGAPNNMACSASFRGVCGASSGGPANLSPSPAGAGSSLSFVLLCYVPLNHWPATKQNNHNGLVRWK